MVANELEKACVQYLTLSLVHAVNAPQPRDQGPPVVVEVPNIGQVRIYKGESNQEIVLPAVIAACNTTEQDNETGNSMCQLVVGVRVQVDPEVKHLKPLEDLATLSTLVFNAMFAADLKDRLNQFENPDFTCIAAVTRSPVKNEVDRNGTHFLNCLLYCAGRNLLYT